MGSQSTGILSCYLYSKIQTTVMLSTPESPFIITNMILAICTMLLLALGLQKIEDTIGNTGYESKSCHLDHYCSYFVRDHGKIIVKLTFGYVLLPSDIENDSHYSGIASTKGPALYDSIKMSRMYCQDI